jgi:predicted enzyme related to lactoylglutathione lyase
MAGQVIHFDIPADDTERARGFYASLLGWEFQPQEGPSEYWLARTGAEPVGGLLPRHGRERRPLIYFDVDDVEAAAAQAQELGGEVVVPKTAVPGKGWLVKVRDTEGNLVGLWQADGSAS